MAQQALAPQSSGLTKDLIKRAFDLIDLNGDGQLQKEEFSAGCDSMGFGLSTDAFNSIFALIDEDASGEIDLDEFCAFILKASSTDSAQLKEFRARLVAIAQQQRSGLTKDLLQRAFDLIDKNGDGQLQKDEFSAGCDGMGFGLPNKQIDAIFSLIDVDGSGEIDFDEFCGFILKGDTDSAQLKDFRARLVAIAKQANQGLTKELLQRAFDLIDKNGDGQLQKEEFSSGCESMGFELSANECDAVFALIDEDGSGEIDFDEFCGFILRANEKDSAQLKDFRSRLIAIVSNVSKETLRNAFDLIDKNGDGELQKDEFLAGCQSMGIALNENELFEIFKCIDVDGSGEIDFDEFTEFLQPQKKNASSKQFGQFRQKLMKLLHSNKFEDYYHFKVNDAIVLQLFNNKAIVVAGDDLKSNGDLNGSINTQFQTEIYNDGKGAYIRSPANGKYLKIDGDKIVFGAKDDNARFKVRKVSIGYFKLESQAHSGKYIGLDLKSGSIVVGRGDPFCRLKALRKGMKPIFSKPYVFAVKNTVVLEHRGGEHIRVEDENKSDLTDNGGKGTLAQWEATPSGGNFVTLRNVANGKFLRISEDGNKIDASGDDGNSSKFKVYPAEAPNHVRLESEAFKGMFVACGENGVCVGRGDKPSLMTVYCN